MQLKKAGVNALNAPSRANLDSMRNSHPDFSTDQALYVISGGVMKTTSLKPAACLTALLLWLLWPGVLRAETGKAPTLHAQLGHAGPVTAAVVSPDGRYVLSGGADHAVKLWDAAIGAEIRTLKGHAETINAVAFFPDGKTILSASGGTLMDIDKPSEVRFWDIRSGKPVRIIKPPSGQFSCAALSPDGRRLVTGNRNKTLALWDAAPGASSTAPLRIFEGHANPVTCVAFTPDGRHVISGSGWFVMGTENALKLWDVSTGREIRTFRGHGNTVTAVAASSDGKRILSGSVDATLRLWDLAGGEAVRVLEGHTGPVTSVAVSADGGLAASGGRDKNLIIWDLTTGREIRRRAFPSSVETSAFSADRRGVLAGGASLTLLDAESLAVLNRFKGYGAAVTCADFSPDDRTIVTAGRDGRIHVWDADAGNVALTLSGHAGPVTAMAFSPDGRRLLSGSRDHAAKLWDLRTGAAVQTFEGHENGILAAAFSPDGKHAATAGRDTTVRLWDAETGRQIRAFEAPLHAAAFSPDGKSILMGADAHDGAPVLADMADGRITRVFESGMFFLSDMTAAAISADGRLALTAYDYAAHLWDMTDGRERRILEGGSSFFHAAVFSPDGRWALAGTDDNAVNVWDLTAETEARILKGHSGPVYAVAASSDGRYALSGGRDGAAILWDLISGCRLITLIALSDGAWVAVDPDGRYDSNRPGDLPGLCWFMPDDPLTPLPVEIFMREYYEPQLLARILNGETFQPVRPIRTLNRRQPSAEITGIRAHPDDPGKVSVTVSVSPPPETPGHASPQHAGVYNLRLFRDGQLAGYAPGNDGEIPVTSETGRRTLRFENIRLPRNRKTVRFSAFCFNEDNIKSHTCKMDYTLPEALEPDPGRAYIVAIGVNAYENPAWDLQYAANDARVIGEIIRRRLTAQTHDYQDIVLIPLISDDGKDGERVIAENPATRATVKAVLDRLSGRPADVDVLARIPHGREIQAAVPEDLVLISFSGHGFADKKGAFHLFLHDIGADGGRQITDDLLRRVVSSHDLARWMRDVDAGEIILIIDACNSAAIVEGGGFKPGPMGSRGLGQLAYDKGMRVLTATQAENVALESAAVRHGLLTYALVWEGIAAGMADRRLKDGRITLDEWLTYGEKRVPRLYRRIRRGDLEPVPMGTSEKGVVVQSSPLPRSPNAWRRMVQKPRLFDFKGRGEDVVIAETD